MDKTCNVFKDFRRKSDRGCTEGERREFEEHLVNCPDCRDQWTSQEALQSLFSNVKPTGLSPSFNEKLHRRISEERRMWSHRPLLMQAYWLAACLVSVFIFLDRLGKNTDAGAMVMLLLGCFAVPTLLLSRTLRFNFIDLILTTMNHPEKRAESPWTR